jgi:hypothetical protein
VVGCCITLVTLFSQHLDPPPCRVGKVLHKSRNYFNFTLFLKFNFFIHDCVRFLQGCMSEIDYWFVKNMYILGVVGITVAVVQVCSLLPYIFLFCFYFFSSKFSI